MITKVRTQSAGLVVRKGDTLCRTSVQFVTTSEKLRRHLMVDWFQSAICKCKSARAISSSMHHRTLMEESSLYSRLPCLESIHLLLTCGDILTWLSYTATTYLFINLVGMANPHKTLRLQIDKVAVQVLINILLS